VLNLGCDQIENGNIRIDLPKDIVRQIRFLD
jgi:hypothetical protein